MCGTPQFRDSRPVSIVRGPVLVQRDAHPPRSPAPNRATSRPPTPRHCAGPLRRTSAGPLRRVSAGLLRRNRLRPPVFCGLGEQRRTTGDNSGKRTTRPWPAPGLVPHPSATHGKLPAPPSARKFQVTPTPQLLYSRNVFLRNTHIKFFALNFSLLYFDDPGRLLDREKAWLLPPQPRPRQGDGLRANCRGRGTCSRPAAPHLGAGHSV